MYKSSLYATSTSNFERNSVQTRTAFQIKVPSLHIDDSMTGEATPEFTSYFEVKIVGGKLIHSKKAGDGYVDTEAKMQKIIKAIGEHLK
ncbi:Selenoprotein W [Trichoplax sp. H2]|nr:Selenoprotein W [Trichoplax sp. H2]|eukprot:RDD47350.1 Selenoprotein W [Trichoplax sp. H2]